MKPLMIDFRKLVFAFVFVWVLPIILLGGYYLDDEARSVFGVYGWSGDYRPFIDLIYLILGFGFSFADLAPFPQIVSAILIYLLVISLVQFYANKLQVDPRDYWLVALLFIPVFLNPFFLQNLYFRYDSLPMTLSIFLCFGEILFFKSIDFFNLNSRALRNMVLIQVAVLFLVLGLYQPSVIVFVSLCLLNLILHWKKSSLPKLLRYMFMNIFVLCFAVFLHQLLIVSLFDPNPYTEKRSFIAFDQDFLVNFLANIRSSFLKIYSVFNTESFYFWLVFFLFALFCLLNVFLSKSLAKNLFILPIFLCLSLVLLSLNVFLDFDEFFAPTFVARTYTSFGMFFSILLVSMFKSLYQQNKRFLILMLLAPNLYFLAISLVTYNAWKAQNEFDAYLINSIAFDLQQLNYQKELNLAFINTPVRPERVNVLIDSFPFIAEIVVQTYSYNAFVPSARLANKITPADIYVKVIHPRRMRTTHQRLTYEVNSLSPLKNNLYYQMFKTSDGSIVFRFKTYPRSL